MKVEEPLITIKDLRFDYRVGVIQRRAIPALAGINITLHRHEIVGLVGESGSGKTTLARIVLGLLSPTSGSIKVEPIAGRQPHIQAIFQDPFEALNHRFTVHDLVAEPLVIARETDSLEEQVMEALIQVGLDPTKEFMARYPHRLSGGQRQRVSIARALVTSPDLLIADEPTSMLDVSVSVGILNLIADLNRKTGIGCLVITHDIAAAAYLCQRLVVMHNGTIIEEGPTDQMILHPRHPYTMKLMAAAMDEDASRGQIEERKVC
jgi:peptide/nickel transport system ATP-binding protein